MSDLEREKTEIPCPGGGSSIRKRNPLFLKVVYIWTDYLLINE